MQTGGMKVVRQPHRLPTVAQWYTDKNSNSSLTSGTVDNNIQTCSTDDHEMNPSHKHRLASHVRLARRHDSRDCGMTP